jgi:hypothetical protein
LNSLTRTEKILIEREREFLCERENKKEKENNAFFKQERNFRLEKRR